MYDDEKMLVVHFLAVGLRLQILRCEDFLQLQVIGVINTPCAVGGSVLLGITGEGWELVKKGVGIGEKRSGNIGEKGSGNIGEYESYSDCITRLTCQLITDTQTTETQKSR